MAVANYNNLKTAIKNWLDDSNLDSFIPDFITLAEAKIYREFRIVPMETALEVTIDGGVAALPSDFQELKNAYVNGSPTSPLEIRPSEWIYRKYPNRTGDSKPVYIGVEGSNFVFGPYPDSNYTIKGTYYKKFAALTDTNWFTDNAFDVLLYASLMQSEGFIGTDERIPLWTAQYEKAKQEVILEDKGKRYGGGPKRTIAS